MKKLTRITLLLCFAIGIIPLLTGCAKDYDDRIRQVEQTVAGNKSLIETALGDEIDLINDQIEVLEKALRDYTDQAKAEAILELTQQLNQIKNGLESKIDALAVQTDGKVKELEKSISDLKDQIYGELAILGDRLDEIDESLNLLTSRVSDLEDRADAIESFRTYAEGVLGELKEATELLDGKLQDLREEFETANEDRKAEIEENTRLIGENKTAIDNLIVELSDLDTKLDNAVTDLEGKIDKAATDAADNLEKAIDKLRGDMEDWANGKLDDLQDWTQGQLDDLQDWTQDQVDDLQDWTQAQVDSLQVRTQRKIDALQGLIDDNAAKITVNTNDISDLKDSLNSTISHFTLEISAVKGRLDSLEERMDTAEDRLDGLDDLLGNLGTRFDQLVESLEDRENGLLADIITSISDVAGDLADALDRIRALEGVDMEDYHTKTEITTLIDDVLNRMSNLRTGLMTYINDILSALELMLSEEEIMEKLDELSEELSTAITQCSERIDEIELRIAQLRADVDKLLGRIQSITYVPDFALGHTYFTGVVSPAQDVVLRLDPVYFTYLISPAAAAQEIADAFEVLPGNFSMITNQTLAMAITTDVVDFQITNIGASADGLLTVVTAPQILDMDQFMEPLFSYQAAFRLSTDKGDDRTSQFVDVLKSEFTTLSFDGLEFTAGGQVIVTDTTANPNDPFWFGQATKMIDVNIDPATGVLAPWDGMQELQATLEGYDPAEAYGLDPSKITYVRSIAGQWIYGNSTNTEILPKTLSFGYGILRSNFANLDYTSQKCMVRLTVRYDGLDISTENYACVRFVK